MMLPIKKLNCSITIFGAISLLLIVSLLFSLTEMCRMRVSKLYMQIISNNAIDSLFSMYHKNLWDTYRIFGLENFDDNILKDEYMTFLKKNIKDNDDYIDNFFIGAIHKDDISLKKYDLLDDVYFEDEILSYMKYGMMNRLIKFNGDYFNVNSQSDKEVLINAINDMSCSHEDSIIYQKLYEKYFDFSDIVRDMEKNAKDAMDNVKQYNETIKCLNLSEDKNKSAVENNYKIIVKIEEYIVNIKKNLDNFVSSMQNFREIVNANKARYEIEKTSYDGFNAEVDKFVLDEFEYFLDYTDENSEINIKVNELFNNVTNVYDYLEEYIVEMKETCDDIQNLEDELDSISRDKDMTSEEKKEAKKDIKDELKDIYEIESEIAKDIMDNAENLCIDEIILPISSTSNFNKTSAFDKIKNFFNDGFMSLCLDEDEISRLSDEHMKYNKYSVDSKNNIVDKIFLSEYALDFFNFYDKENYDMNTTSGANNLEVEAIISGENSDKSSLSCIINKILLIREGCNIAFLYSNQSKRNIARNFAYTMFAPFSIVVKEMMFIVVLSSWAMCQSFVDTYNILHHKNVPFMHDENTFEFSIDNILDLSLDVIKNTNSSDDNKGLNYVDYLRLIIIIDNQKNINSRMTSIIQYNMEKGQSNFSMDNMLFGIKSSNVFNCKHFFTNFVLYTPKYERLFDDYKMNIDTYYDYIE